MAENLPKNEYEQRQYEQKEMQRRLINASQKRREDEILEQEESDPEEFYDQENVQHPMFGTQATNGYRISFFMAWALFITALLVDLAELLITWAGFVVVGGFLTSILSVAATALFGFWFIILGVNYSSNTKRFFTGLVTVLLELLPWVDAAPLLAFAWTGGMIITVGMVRMEDRGEEPTILGALREFTAMSTVHGFIYSKIKHRGKPIQKNREGLAT